MPTAWLCQIDAFARADGAARVIRVASHDDDRLCHLDPQTPAAPWWPAIARLPTFAYDFFDGAFGGEIITPTGRADLSIEAVPNYATLMLHGARIRWWSGELGAAWGSYTLRFDGLIDDQPPVRDGVAAVEFRVDDRWLDDPLLATYAGTTGAEGEAAQKGQVKPLMLGAPRMAEGVLIDTIDTIIQLNDGPIEGVEVAMEDAARFAAPVANYASFAALDAATIAPGLVATGLAVGLVRHGAPGDGVLTYDVKGSNSGGDGGGWVRRAGAIVRRLADRQGKLAKVDSAAMTALDIARPWNVSLALTSQTTMRQVVQSLAQSINAVALVTWTGQLTILPIDVPEDATPVGILASDGSAEPPVARVDQLSIAVPWWRTAIEAEVTHRVHSTDEIRFTAALIPGGRYDPAESYREGQIVDLADGSRWLYVATTPTVGNDPPVWPVTSNAWWENLTPPTATGKMFVQATPPTAEESAGSDKWVDSLGRYWVRREDIRMGIGGQEISIGGVEVTIAWTENPTQPILTTTEAAKALALDAQATADGKVRSFYEPTPPVAESVGDLWFDTNDGNKQYRWSGAFWIAVQDGAIGDALTAAAGAQATADGKVTTFISESAPAAEGIGDLWFKESTGALRRWDGSVWGDPLVDLTSAAVPRHDPASATVTLSSSHLGVIDPVQLPSYVTIRRFRGSDDVTAAATWTIEDQGSVTGGTVTVSGGAVELPSGISVPPEGATIRVKSARDGFDLFSEITLQRNDAPIPNTGGGGTSVNDSTVDNVSTASFVQVSDTMTVKTGASGVITFGGILSILAEAAAPTGTFGAVARWGYQLAAGGSTSYAGADIDDTGGVRVSFDSEFGIYRSRAGQINVGRTQGSLSPSTDYHIWLEMKRDSSSPAKTLSFGGGVTATGS